jgi:hypothetical protein
MVSDQRGLWSLLVALAYVSDLEVEGPTVIPGYLEIIPPVQLGLLAIAPPAGVWAVLAQLSHFDGWKRFFSALAGRQRGFIRPNGCGADLPS